MYLLVGGVEFRVVTLCGPEGTVYSVEGEYAGK